MSCLGYKGSECEEYRPGGDGTAERAETTDSRSRWFCGNECSICRSAEGMF